MNRIMIVLFIVYMNSLGAQGLVPMKQSSAPHLPAMDMSQYGSKLKAAKTYLEQGDYDQAVDLLLVAQKEKQTAKLFEYLGDAYTAQRIFVKAVAAYQKAFSLYIQKKQKQAAQKIFRNLKYYQTDETKELNKKFEKSLRSL